MLFRLPPLSAQTPLDWAIRTERPEVAAMLREFGAHESHALGVAEAAPADDDDGSSLPVASPVDLREVARRRARDLQTRDQSSIATDDDGAIRSLAHRIRAAMPAWPFASKDSDQTASDQQPRDHRRRTTIIVSEQLTRTAR